jgi:hypothetical protein
VFENRALRGMCGHKRKKITGNWRKPHNGEFVIGNMHGEMRNAYKVLFRKHEGKTQAWMGVYCQNHKGRGRLSVD